jgi:hypothetical protein
MKDLGRLEDIVPFRRRSGIPPRAGIFLLEGRYHVAAPGTEDEARLRGRGALEVAAVTFAGPRTGRPVDGGGPGPDAELAPIPLGGVRGAAAILGWRPARN